jgi:hypothetical protein
VPLSVIGQAMAEAEPILAKVKRLEAELRRCTSAPDGNRTIQRRAAPQPAASRAEL